MSSSEDDYMSDTFLVGCVKDDIRPGLIMSHESKRQHEMLKKKQEKDEENKNKNPSVKVAELEKREVALNQPLPVDNKGFAMLQKLGFQPGSGLGKSNAGRVEPVPIKLKTDRQGLGHAEAVKESLARKTSALKAARSKAMNVDDYRSHLAEKTAERRVQMDLKKSQKICKHLDTNTGVVEPEEYWYWPEYESKDSDNTFVDDDDECNDVDRLNARENIQQDDEDEKDEEQEEYYEEKEEVEYTVKEKLETLTYYLRSVHYYCIWCAVQYDDERDLHKECPGPTYDDH